MTSVICVPPMLPDMSHNGSFTSVVTKDVLGWVKLIMVGYACVGTTKRRHQLGAAALVLETDANEETIREKENPLNLPKTQTISEHLGV